MPCFQQGQNFSISPFFFWTDRSFSHRTVTSGSDNAPATPQPVGDSCPIFPPPPQKESKPLNRCARAADCSFTSQFQRKAASARQTQSCDRPSSHAPLAGQPWQAGEQRRPRGNCRSVLGATLPQLTLTSSPLTSSRFIPSLCLPEL